MNKHIVDKMLTSAHEYLLSSNKFINSPSKGTYRGYAAAFGAAVIMSGYGAAASFYVKKSGEGQKGDSSGPQEDRTVITMGILEIIRKVNSDTDNYSSLYDYIEKKRDGNIIPVSVKEDIESAAIALKLAMNLFNLDNDKKKDENKGDV